MSMRIRGVAVIDSTKAGCQLSANPAPSAVHGPVWCEGKADRLAGAVSDHTGLGGEAAPRERPAPRCSGMLRHFAPLSCRQTVASMVRRRLWCTALWGGGHSSISGASFSHCASVKAP